MMYFYQNSIKKLSQTLSQKFGVSIDYSQNPLPDLEQNKWNKKEGFRSVIPLSVNKNPLGHIQVPSSLNDGVLDEIYLHTHWLINSLEDLSWKYGGEKFLQHQNFPLFIQSANNEKALNCILNIYEKSSAVSFIHCLPQDFNKNLFTKELKGALVFVSNLRLLSRENQLFLSHYLRTKKEGPFSAVSDEFSLEEALEKKEILPSLIECFKSSHV